MTAGNAVGGHSESQQRPEAVTLLCNVLIQEAEGGAAGLA